MMLKTDDRVEVIDFFRGISIIGIIFYHLISLYMLSMPQIVKYGANLGSSGVLIFFFCSGFSLYYSQQRKPKSWGLFIRKKIVAIYFPYIIVVIVSALFADRLFPDVKRKFIAVLSHVLQFRIISKQYFESFGGHWWYLGTLFQFFILFFALKKILDRLGEKKFLLFCLTISIGYVGLLAFLKQDNNIVLVRLFPKYLIEFGFGMVIAKMIMAGELHKIKIDRSKYFCIGVLGVVILGFSGASTIGRLLNDIPSFVGIISLAFWGYGSVNSFSHFGLQTLA